MILERAQLKADAREAMRGRTPSTYLVALAFIVILAVLEMLGTRLQFPGVTLAELFSVETEAQADRIMNAYLTSPGVLNRLLSYAVSLMEMMITVGFISYTLCVSRRIDAGFDELFAAFGNFFRLLALRVLTALLVFAWSLLLIVPGIIAAYRYSLAVYIQLADPDKSPIDCLRESRERTSGWKMQLFLFDLSFIGWYLLSAVPFVSVYTMPYIYTAKANAYRVITGRMDEPAHVDFTI